MLAHDNIDRVIIGKGTFSAENSGDGKSASATNVSLTEIVHPLLSENQDGFILFHHENLTVNESSLKSLIRMDPCTALWYDDRISGVFHVPHCLEMVSPGIYFNLKTSEEGFSIWNLSMNCLLVKKEVLRKAGFLDNRFLSLEGAVMEWIHRLLYAGVLIQRAHLADVPHVISGAIVPVEDELRFVKYRFGQKWLLWCAVRYFLQGRIGLTESLRAFKKVKQEPVIPVKSRMDHSEWRQTSLGNEKYNISIIIPTIERYPYLVTVLNQLREQRILPYEVIVIDQTPEAFREPQLFDGYTTIGLKYFNMNKSGQCRSRNLGLTESSGDYILFIDDDVEIKPELLEDHLKCLKYFNADVSCGVCDEVGAGPIPFDYTFIRHSDVFPTNNGMVKRSVLEKSGLFDMAFDHGQRADGDLGARIYKAGARLILNPQIRVLHHRAPRGGLRKHNVRKVTYSSSRKFITHFRLPHISELYLNKIHFSAREQREYVILTLLGLFSIQGGKAKKILKIAYAGIMLPRMVYKIFNRNRKATGMLHRFPEIPRFRKSDFPKVDKAAIQEG